jgi:fructose-1,6-bisphosphatase/inositol monophosphatase family enzyme
MAPYQAELDTALEAAHVAGALLRRKFRQTRDIRYKGPRDIVTDADEAAQAAIRDLIAARFPRHAFLGEEGRHTLDLLAAGPTWVVDPLDGTSNYARQFPFFCVSIGLSVDGRPQAGVIYDPIRNETYWAVRGQGAFIQRGHGRPGPMRASAITDMSEALIGVDWSRDAQLRAQVIAGAARVGELCRTIRATGSAALGLAYIAAGWLDGYVNLALAPWDVAAGSLIIEEAGGLITTATGTPWSLGEPAVAASNGSLHNAFIEALGFGHA